MKVIIQDKTSGKYLFSTSSWTEKEDEALDFESIARGKQFCRQHDLQGAVIIVRQRNTEADVVIPTEEVLHRPGYEGVTPLATVV